MHRMATLAITLAVPLVLPLGLAACGGGKSSVPTLSVACSGGVQLNGAKSLDVLGDVVNGRPTMEYPDPVSPSRTGSIAVPPRGRCTITPQTPS